MKERAVSCVSFEIKETLECGLDSLVRVVSSACCSARRRHRKDNMMRLDHSAHPPGMGMGSLLLNYKAFILSPSIMNESF